MRDVAFELMYDDTTTTTITEVEVYPFMEMLNELAGIANFCFGVRVVSLVAIFEALYRWANRNNAFGQLKFAMRDIKKR
jgi:hypothetical protein